MRHRAVDDSYPNPVKQVKTENYLGNVYETEVVATGLDSFVGVKKTIDDVVTVSFKTLKREGEIIMNPLTIYRESRSEPSGTFVFGPHRDFMGIKTTYTVTGRFMSHHDKSWTPWKGISARPEFGHDVLVGENEALNKAYAKAYTAEFAGITFAAELAQTLSMLKNPLNLCNMMARKFKRQSLVKVKAGLSLTEAHTNTWLELRYGWLPLLMDIKTIVDRANKIPDKQKQRRVFRASVGGSWSDNGLAEVTSEKVPYLTSLSCNVEQNLTWRANAGVVVDVYDTSATHWNRNFLGLVSQDIPLALWEAVPLSFVADWFLNLSDVLKINFPKPNIAIRGDWTTSIQDYDMSCGRMQATRYFDVSPLKTYTATCESGYNKHWYTMNRKVNQGAPGGIALKSDLTLSTNHILDSLSLTAQRVGKALGSGSIHIH